MRQKIFSLTVVVISLLFLLLNGVVSAATLTLNHSSRGIYGQGDLLSGPPSLGTYVVSVALGPGQQLEITRNFFVFDLSSVTSTIIGAELRLQTLETTNLTNYSYQVHDISTDPSLLGVDASPAIFDDLGDGPVYGLTSDFSGLFTSVSLNPAGLSALNMSQGQQFAVGGRFIPEFLAGGFDNALFRNFGGVTNPTTQLVLELDSAPVPEPSTIFLFGSGLIGLIGWQYRKKQIQ